MLQETEDFLKKIKYNINTKKKFKLKFWLLKNKKKIRNISLIFLIFMILLFPQFMGGIIGNWIVNFIGTIVKIISAGF